MKLFLPNGLKPLSTVNFTNISTNYSFILPFTQANAIGLSVVIWVLFVLGLFGNVVTIATATWSPKLKSSWFLLITSLSVSDLLSTLLSPLQLYNHTAGYLVYKWSEVFCKLLWAGDTFTSYSTTLHVLSFALLRFISLQYPHQFKSVISTYVKKIMLVIWLLAFGFGFVPFAVSFRITHRNRGSSLGSDRWTDCGLAEDWREWFSNYVQVAYPVFYYFPCVFVIVCSIGIGVMISLMRKKRKSLRGQQNLQAAEVKKRKQERHILLQLFVIVGSFLLGYFPVTAYYFYALWTPYTTDQAYWDSVWIFGASSFALLRISECLNPVLYNLSSGKMRLETKAFLAFFWKKISCSNPTQAHGLPVNSSEISKKLKSATSTSEQDRSSLPV